MSKLYQQFGGGMKNPMEQMIGNIQAFRSAFKGNPRDQINSLINSGAVPQDALNKAQQMAKPIYEMMKGLK